jgi:glycosidase
MHAPVRHNVLKKTILLALAILVSGSVSAQSVDVPFRYPDSAGTTSVTVPGTFNGWQTSGASFMQRVDSLGQWLRTLSLTPGQTVQYKFFVSTSAGSQWITDPHNARTNPADNNNSVLEVIIPSVFQPILRTNEDGLVSHYTAGVIAAGRLQSATLAIGGSDPVDVTSRFDPVSRVLQVQLDNPVVAGTRFDLLVQTEDGQATSTLGTLSAPLALTTVDRRTTESTFRLRGVATSSNGQVDSTLTQVAVLRNGVIAGTAQVVNGQIDTTVQLEEGDNRFTISATIDDTEVLSDEVVLTRWEGPLADRWFSIAVSGSANSFEIEVVETSASPGLVSISYTPDEALSTSSLMTFSGSGNAGSGVVSGPGEVFIDIMATDADGQVQYARAAILIDADGSISDYDWADTAAWIDQAVVYEIFPLSFGPVEASGTVGNEGNRFNEIREELDYVAGMGFNTIWFMPIMRNMNMDQIGGGYNVIDFYTVDPKLGTNDDFKALVTRAHELGIRIILDLTINHASPDHPWVSSLSSDGDYPGFVQTTPSPHNRGEDSRGSSLPEQWSDNGQYRVYDGFGQLANLNWDNDDLQAEMLDVISWWLTEFKVDGFRFDAFWGPWRRYGAERFGRPVRELIRHIRPDSWLLGEIEGTGNDTEVYYADAVNGRPYVGGLDSGYDWTYSSFLRNPVYYARVSDYQTRMTNYGFSPGPNARVFRFLENHDESRIQQVHRSSPGRVRTLTGLLMTGPGIPMVFQGQEVGYGEGSGDRRRLPVNWTTSNNGQWAQWHRLWASTRSRFPAFGTQDVTFLNAPGSAMAFVRPYLDENALVLINFAGSPQAITVDPSQAVLMSTDGPIPYFDVASDTSATYLDAFSVTLDAYEVVTYITSGDASLNLGPLPSLPFSGIYTGSERAHEQPDSEMLQPPWPNPSAGAIRFAWSVSTPGRVDVDLFDMLGRKVISVHAGFAAPGAYSESVNLGSLSGGVYMVRYTGPDGSETKSIVLHQ